MAPVVPLPFHKSKLYITYLNLLLNSVIQDLCWWFGGSMLVWMNKDTNWAGMGDHLQMGKSPQYVTSHPSPPSPAIHLRLDVM